MMTKTNLKHFVLMLMAVLAMASCGGDDESGGGGTPTPTPSANANCNDASKNSVYARLEFPKLKGGSNNIVIIHQVRNFGINYCVEWDSDLRPAGWNAEGSLRAQRWSCYQMHAGNSQSNTKRWEGDKTVDFGSYPNDPDLPKAFQFTEDPYWSTGYDHGHICPSADRLWSQEVNMQTFYMTNMQPQVNGFNGQVWSNMEAQVRRWNSNSFRDTLYVVKGGTIDRSDQIITTIGRGQNKIPVPKFFFMALLCKKGSNSTSGGYRALGFWIQHKSNSSADLRPYVVNIDELEQLTGIDFFCNLPDKFENVVESLPQEQVRRAWNLE